MNKYLIIIMWIKHQLVALIETSVNQLLTAKTEMSVSQ